MYGSTPAITEQLFQEMNKMSGFIMSLILLLFVCLYAIYFQIRKCYLPVGEDGHSLQTGGAEDCRFWNEHRLFFGILALIDIALLLIIIYFVPFSDPDFFPYEMWVIINIPFLWQGWYVPWNACRKMKRRAFSIDSNTSSKGKTKNSKN